MAIYAMKLSDWARQTGISYKTAWLQYRAGILPVPARQLPTGTIIVDDDRRPDKVVIYARVSSHDQKADLSGQVHRCLDHAKTLGLAVSESVTEIGSGMNGQRKKLARLLADPDLTHLIVEHRDRLMRLGSEFVESALAGRHVNLIIVDRSELNDDLVQDMISVLTSFCARLYGRRSARNRTQRAMAALSSSEAEA